MIGKSNNRGGHWVWNFRIEESWICWFVVVLLFVVVYCSLKLFFFWGRYFPTFREKLPWHVDTFVAKCEVCDSCHSHSSACAGSKSQLSCIFQGIGASMVTALFNRRLAKLADEKGIELPEDMLVIEIFWEEKVMLSKVRRLAQDYTLED